MPSPALLAPTNRRRTRSVGFLDHDGVRWACYLVTHRSAANTWRGHLAFRTSPGQPAKAAPSVHFVRTAEIFIEPSESEIDRKARQMGRPLLLGLLASALEVEEAARQEALAGRRGGGWVREALRDRAGHAFGTAHGELGEHGEHGGGSSEDAMAAGQDRTTASGVALARSRYETYRIDQLTHLVCLMDPEALDQLVDETLAGESFGFGARDRLQFAMMVVQRLEALLPLPPLDVFLADEASRPGVHERYHHELHAGGPLP